MQDIQETIQQKVEEYQIHPRIEACLIVLFVCSAIFITTFFIYLRAISAQTGEIQEGLVRSTQIIAATLIDPDALLSFVSQSQKLSPEYIKALEPLRAVQRNDKSLKYIWAGLVKNNKAYFVLDTIPPSEADAVKIMEEYSDAPPELFKSYAEKRALASQPYTDKWGNFITAYAPIFDKKEVSKIVGILSVTIDVSNYLRRLEPIKFATARALVTGLSLSLLMGLGTWFMRRFALEVNKSRMGIMEKLRISVVTDGLTGLFNRRYFDLRYAAMYKEALESKTPLTVIMTDVDHFKSVNDTYGHVPGDEILQQVARRLSQYVRMTDMVARYGGEEFVVLLPDTTLEDARGIAERIRVAVEAEPFKISAGDGILSKTTSLGVATLRDGDTMQSLLKRADAGLYIAKEGGRNRVAVAENGDEGHA